ncbi:hypothetical protein LUX32_08635 [Actinomadura madurae]|nr:hypothetical protein [Actinomadura madurae]MCP9977700.1 hypothetical protein [Actinomadura madurae]
MTTADAPGGDGVVGLDGEEAAAALDQRDPPRRESGEVVGLASAAGSGGARVDRAGGGGDVAGAGVLQGREVGVGSERLLLGLGLGEDRLGQLLPEVELEVLDRGGVPGPLELVRDVLDGDLVAGEPGGPVAAVGVRDLLQVELVMADVLQRDQPGQLGRGRCGGLGGHRGQGGGGERQPGEGG